MPLALAGLQMTDDSVSALACLLDKSDPELSSRLRDAIETGTDEVTLTIPDRGAILLALDNERDSIPLAQLRAALLADHLERRMLGL